MPDLERFVIDGLLEPKAAESARVRRWLARSQKDISVATRVLADIDAERAMSVTYEAGLLRIPTQSERHSD